MKAGKIRPLSSLKAGEKGRIVSVSGEEKERLESLGLFPGVQLTVERSRPAYIVVVGHTRLFLEAPFASFIYVLA